MAKNERRSNNRVTQIFDDLEDYLAFCKDYGYKFDEADLYNQRSFVYRQYCKVLQGKPVKNMWEIDGKPV